MTNTPLPVVLLGAGGHARVLLSGLLALKREVRGCIAPTPPPPDFAVQWSYLGDDTELEALPRGEVELVIAVGSTRASHVRRDLFLRAKGMGFTVASVIHPQAVVASDVVLGEGAQVMAGAILQAGCVIGANVIVNSGAIIEHGCLVADHGHVATGAVLAGDVRVGEGCHVGAGAVVLQGLSIGAGATVGAGAIVTHDVAAEATVVGVPARQKTV
jgi:sugar O-acyltransferase (sialic acid O-acetyltransferase NeuD family)